MSMDIPKENDQKGENSGVKYAVCSDSVEYLKGTEIDFDDGLG